MRQRVRLDLGQQVSSAKVTERFQRKQQRWATVNRNKDSIENPFIKAISPSAPNYGEVDETEEELRERLNNLEFGNFRGYFNYRNKAVVDNQDKSTIDTKESSISVLSKDSDPTETTDSTSKNVDSIGSIASDSGVSDERISHFKEEWIKGKNVLDIGCNRGHITYTLARRFSPKYIVGIDIDPKLISMANKDIHMFLKESLIEPRRSSKLDSIRLDNIESSNNKVDPSQRIDRDHDNAVASNSKPTLTTTIPSLSTNCDVDSKSIDPQQEKSQVIESDEFPISNYIDQGPLGLISNPNESSKDYGFPNNLIFVEHNYVPSSDQLVEKQKPHFDTIVCLSVTKWIHLNYRDDGLKRFFKRAYNHLNPDGLFILEAQPYDNYARRKRTSDRLKTNFYSIKFKPENFDEFLLSEEVGFRRIIYESKTDHQCKGFKRPIKVFLK